MRGSVDLLLYLLLTHPGPFPFVPSGHLSSINMPSLTLSFSLVAAAIALGSCFCGGNDDDPIPQRPSYSSSDGPTQIQTQPSYRPPPLPQAPSYTYRPPETYAPTTPRTPAPLDYSRGVNQSKVGSPYIRTNAWSISSVPHSPTAAFRSPTAFHFPIRFN